MSRVVNKTNSIIDDLASDLEPVKALRHPFKRALPWLIFTIFYVLFGIFMLGARGDFVSKLSDSTYIFEMSLVLVMSISATMCSLWMCVPDMRGQKWLLATSLTLIFVTLAWIVTQAVMNMDHVPYGYWSHCFKDAVFFGLLPAASIVFLSMKGSTTKPYLMILMNIIAVSGLGYIGLRVTCASDDIGHICVFHILPYIALGAVIGAIGRRFYRW